MKKAILTTILLCSIFYAFSQNHSDSISAIEIKRIVTFLSSDELKGRGNYSIELKKAADFISNEFAAANLQPFDNYATYFMPFTTKSLSDKELSKDSLGNYNPENILLNIVGVLPGKSLADEAVIFSAHYDHLGKATSYHRDSIYNGANDNASGVAALLVLAKYFSLRADNERTLIFCAFAGEELGLFGSDVFAEKVNAANIKAVINMDMIGRSPSKRKRNSMFIVGAGKSTFSKIFSSNINKEEVTILKEPDERKMLFMRSDHFPFAHKGIPAHTISSIDDEDLCYHKICDDITRIDFEHLHTITKAIASGSRTIISGKETPSRIIIK